MVKDLLIFKFQFRPTKKFSTFIGSDDDLMINKSWFKVSDLLSDLPCSRRFDAEAVYNKICEELTHEAIAQDESNRLLMTDINGCEESIYIKKPEVFGNVYLMKNLRNSYMKIGFTTKHPQYREATLQSQEPEIELVKFWEATIDDERQLHSMFDKKRLRGEWFELNSNDIKKIEHYFQNENRG